jgi:5'-deoxynucleotidase YfbR-like
MRLELKAETLDPRRAGQVTRYHTWPRIREQSVGEHSWQVLRVLLAIWPDAPRHVIVHCLTHDIGETVSGDPPYPVKAMNPDMKEACDRVELDAHRRMARDWFLPGPSHLSDMEKTIFKMAEFIEMWEWALFEISMGNSNAVLVMERCLEAMIDRESYLRDGFGNNVLAAGVLVRTGQYCEKRTGTTGRISRE